LIDQGVKAAFEKSLFQRAIAAAGEMRSLMDSAQFADHLKRLNDDYIAGDYALVSPRGKKALEGNGFITLLSLLFNEPEATILRVVKMKPIEIVALFKVIMQESFGVTQEELDKAIAAEQDERKKKAAG
jgi:hypothetical protein